MLAGLIIQHLIMLQKHTVHDLPHDTIIASGTGNSSAMFLTPLCATHMAHNQYGTQARRGTPCWHDASLKAGIPNSKNDLPTQLLERNHCEQ